MVNNKMSKEYSAESVGVMVTVHLMIYKCFCIHV